MKHVRVIVMVILFMTSLIYAQASFPANSMGFGLGIPYGILGANVDLNVIPNLNITAGGGIGYSVGFKYFFRSIDYTCRPRASIYYGTNAVKVTEYSGSDKEDDIDLYDGLSLGIGTQWMWGLRKSNGLDLDMIFIVMTTLDEADEFTAGISIGYRHAFHL